MMLDDVVECQHLLAEITYKPGWRFSITPYSSRPAMGFLLIEYMAEDTYTNAGMIKIGRRIPMPRCFADGKHFLRWIFEQIMLTERHESSEWFRFRSVMIYDPHSRG